MLLIQTAVLASLASASGAPAVAGSAARAAPMWAVVAVALRAPLHRLRLTPSCSLLRGKPTAPCNTTISGPPLDALPVASPAYAAESAQLPALRGEEGTLGGFLSFDVMKALHLSVGPRVSWLTPDSPREDLLRLRVVAPGWGVRYTWQDAISVGVATGTRFLMLGEDWPVVDVLTSEASIELLLP